MLEKTLGRVDVGKIERRARVAGVEDGGEAHTWHKRLHHDAVHFVIDDVFGLFEVDRVDYFVVAVVFIAVFIKRLATVACDCQYWSICVC